MTIKPGQKFRGDRGTREITVKSFDKHNEQVIFRRSDYPHDCMLPKREFIVKFTERLN